MVQEKSFANRLFDVFNYLLLAFISICSLLPMLHTLFCSVSTPAGLAQKTGLMFYPHGFCLQGYSLVWNNRNIMNGFANTFIYVISATVLSLFLTSMGAYVTSRKQFRLRNVLTIMIVFTMYFSGGLIPTYLVVKGLGLVNNRLAMILPSAISAWNLILLRTSFAEVPVSLEESAKIDGANDFYILFRIFIPVSQAAIAVIVLLYAVGNWNSWFNALIYLRDRELFPLQLILKEILIQNDETKLLAVETKDDLNIYRSLIKYCVVIISVVPIIIVYPFLQKYFVKGMMIGAIKG